MNVTSLLLCIHSYPGGNAAFARHYPYFKQAGADWILGIGTTDGKCEWPAGCDHIDIGENRYLHGDHLCRRLLNTLHFWLARTEHSHCCVVEYDSIFLKPIPRELPNGLVTHLAGGNPGPSFKCSRFYHTPWICDRDTGRRIVECGRAMLAAGDIEMGSPDCFLGLMAERYNIPVHTNVMHVYSRNGFDYPGHIEEARAAIANGAHFVHGVKDEHILNRILAP